MGNNGNNKRWTVEDDAYVRQHLGKMSLEDMAAYLDRSPMSVRLYILRHRMTSGHVVKRNLLVKLLKIKFRHPENFNPTRDFYKETGIGQRRYWDLFFGRKKITGKEYQALTEYFGVTIDEDLDARQLKLFEEDPE